MGWRFRKSVKLFPGVRLNISKGGISTTIGPRGASVNLGKRGTQATVGVPGTGVSYSTLLSGGGMGQPTMANQMGRSSTGKISGVGWAVVALLTLVAIGRCAPSTTDSNSPSPFAAPAVAASTRYVTARSLNCRAGASAGAAVVRTLAQRESVTIAEESAGWSKIDGVTVCWAASKHLSPTASTAIGLPGGQTDIPASGNGGEMATPSISGGGNSAALTAATGGAAAYLASSSTKAKARAKAPRKAGVRKSRRGSSGGYGGSSCPCNGGNVCIGPRGGRYCITSGGNKRYGV